MVVVMESIEYDNGVNRGGLVIGSCSRSRGNQSVVVCRPSARTHTRTRYTKLEVEHRQGDELGIVSVDPPRVCFPALSHILARLTPLQ